MDERLVLTVSEAASVLRLSRVHPRACRLRPASSVRFGRRIMIPGPGHSASSMTPEPRSRHPHDPP